MSSSHKNNIILTLYQNRSSVFRLKDIALLTGESNFQNLNNKLNYYVRTNKLQNPRKGIYTKPNYNVEELACKIYAPSYISLEYVLQKAGVIFQYDSRINIVSYLSRIIEVEEKEYLFRKIKGEILTNTAGIERQDNHVNIATPERAFLDLLYLNKDYYFDNLNPLKKRAVNKLLPQYNSKILSLRVKKLFNGSNK